MTSENRPYPIIDRLIETVGDWFIHRRAIHEIEEFCGNSATEFSRIAHDLGVTADTLDAFVRKGPHAADQLPKLLKELGISEANLAKAHPQLLLDMQRVCAFCEQKGVCNKDLVLHTVKKNYEKYCENAQTITAVKGELEDLLIRGTRE
jgi:hypothetical protein